MIKIEVDDEVVERVRKVLKARLSGGHFDEITIDAYIQNVMENHTKPCHVSVSRVEKLGGE